MTGLAKLLWVPPPADHGPGQPWRPGTPPPAALETDTPGADIRIGYARCNMRRLPGRAQLASSFKRPSARAAGARSMKP
ncbi:hypothetical protein GCM10017674_80020 [Streptomyces gardneri]|uniref:Uncharacterized protein n=1 Tax=Streptomyces gardneri TaxID=66892 RepID=A0A4Y3RZ79_9ACTN|nr:hypothetical protein SGA01_77180 [Streptomyces gardneri]GHH23438.1 hypothetical protein GCM10017674_80020 [Streptomyces gardneri]